MGKYSSAARGMLSWLHANEIKGGPVSQPTKKDPVILVYGMTRAGIEKLPATFEGFKVEGTARAPDYDRNQLRDVIPRPKGPHAMKD